MGLTTRLWVGEAGRRSCVGSPVLSADSSSDAKDPLAYSRGFSQTNFIAHHSPKTLFEIGDGPFLRGLSRVPHIVRIESISRSATPATCFSSVHMLSMTSFIFVAIPEDFPYVVRE